MRQKTRAKDTGTRTKKSARREREVGGWWWWWGGGVGKEGKERMELRALLVTSSHCQPARHALCARVTGSRTRFDDGLQELILH
jgi:hypothetical protein